jgi:hypothetical protein
MFFFEVHGGIPLIRAAPSHPFRASVLCRNCFRCLALFLSDGRSGRSTGSPTQKSRKRVRRTANGSYRRSSSRNRPVAFPPRAVVALLGYTQERRRHETLSCPNRVTYCILGRRHPRVSTLLGQNDRAKLRPRRVLARSRPPALPVIYCASVSQSVRCVSTIVRRTPASVSANTLGVPPALPGRQ